MKKRGNFKFKSAQSHLELILSFVIFVGFVFAIFLFLNPLKQPYVNYLSFETIQAKILENATINYRTIPIILNKDLNPTQIGDCFSINNTLNINGNLLVKSGKEDRIKNAINDSKKIYIEYGPGKETSYTLYISENLNNYSDIDSAECTELGEANYSLGALRYGKDILYENLFVLDKLYMEDYALLLDNLGIEDNFEFAVYALDKTSLLNNSLSLHKTKITSVISRDILLKSIDKNATQIDIFLNLKVW
jgi:hypothetical protein